MQRIYPRLLHYRRIGVGLAVALITLTFWLPSAARAEGLQGMEWGNCRSTHPVQYGQTLQAIANYYGVNLYALMQANQLDNPNRIYAGQTLCIPSDGMPDMAGSPPMRDGRSMHDRNDMHTMDNMDNSGNVSYRPDGHDMGDMDHRPDRPNGPPQANDGAAACYIVQPGDTLAQIAWRYGVDVPYLMQLNGLRDPNHLEVGQELKVAGGYTPNRPNGPYQPQPPYGQPPQPPQVMNDWQASYFNNEDLSGSPQFTRTDGDINFNWGNDGPGGGLSNDNFSVRWTRDTYLPAGNYRFFVTADDGVRLYVDNTLIIDGWHVQPPTDYYGDVHLEPGTHTLRLDYYEETGGALILIDLAAAIKEN